MVTPIENKKPPVVFVPGGVMPSELAYNPLLDIVGQEIQPIVKELEVYRFDQPQLDYSLETEVEGIKKAANEACVKSFHLVGYSAGGASALAYTARYPERVRSLALIEPAWIGKTSPENKGEWDAITRLMALPDDERMKAFMRWQMRPGTEPPSLPLPPGPPPVWMAKRPAGLVAVMQAFNSYNLDQQRFREFDKPVYYALGGLSTPFYEKNAGTLSKMFPDMQVEMYDERSHLDPPHRSEAERFARAMRDLWKRGEKVYASERQALHN